MLLDKGVVVARLGVTDGAIVTLGRVELRLVDAWDWARALRGIFGAARSSVFKGLLKQEGALRRSAGQRSGNGLQEVRSNHRPYKSAPPTAVSRSECCGAFLLDC